MHRRRLILVGAAFTGVAVALLAYHVFGGTGMQTAEEMQRSLAAEIPVGTSVNEAESRLQKRGFRVLPMTDASYATRQHLDYLYGDMSEGAALLTHRRWQVAVIHQNGAVTEICVTTGLVAP